MAKARGCVVCQLRNAVNIEGLFCFYGAITASKVGRVHPSAATTLRAGLTKKIKLPGGECTLVHQHRRVVVAVKAVPRYQGTEVCRGIKQLYSCCWYYCSACGTTVTTETAADCIKRFIPTLTGT